MQHLFHIFTKFIYLYVNLLIIIDCYSQKIKQGIIIIPCFILDFFITFIYSNLHSHVYNFISPSDGTSKSFGFSIYFLYNDNDLA